MIVAKKLTLSVHCCTVHSAWSLLGVLAEAVIIFHIHLGLFYMRLGVFTSYGPMCLVKFDQTPSNRNIGQNLPALMTQQEWLDMLATTSAHLLICGEAGSG